MINFRLGMTFLLAALIACNSSNENGNLFNKLKGSKSYWACFNNSSNEEYNYQEYIIEYSKISCPTCGDGNTHELGYKDSFLIIRNQLNYILESSEEHFIIEYTNYLDTTKMDTMICFNFELDNPYSFNEVDNRQFRYESLFFEKLYQMRK